LALFVGTLGVEGCQLFYVGTLRLSPYALCLALDAIQDADKQKQGLASRRGPFLIAWAPSESRFVPDAVVLVLDLSDKDSQRSFTEVFQD
jgi:hypothetical protein